MSDFWVSTGRRLRDAYDAPSFGPGPRAELRRERTSAELAFNGHFLSLVGRAGLGVEDLDALAPVVWLFPAAEHRASGRFELGKYLRQEIFHDVKNKDLPTRARRFRQLIAAHERDERLHHLRRLLVHAFQRNRRPVDWGVLTHDLTRFGDLTRRRWAESFFLPAPTSPAPEAHHV